MRTLLVPFRAKLVAAGFLIILLLGWGWWRAGGGWFAGRAGEIDSKEIIYLGWDAQGLTQLYTLNLTDTAVRQLTDTAAGVDGYAISADGQRIAYLMPSNKPEFGQIIAIAGRYGRQEEVVFPCFEANCSNLVWASDSRRLLFEKRPWSEEPSRLPGAPQLWWLDVDSGDTLPVLADDEAVASAGSDSADGSWIAFIAPAAETLTLYHFENGRLQQFPGQAGIPVAWHPSDNLLLHSELSLAEWPAVADDHDESEHRHLGEAVHLFLINADTGDRSQLTVEPGVDDGNAAWSPDGRWIAWGRRPARTDAGRQLWRMRADGSDPSPLTNDPRFHHGPPSWSADGRLLLFQRYDLHNPESDPSIWLLDLDSGELRELVAAGYLPKWLLRQGDS